MVGLPAANCLDLYSYIPTKWRHFENLSSLTTLKMLKWNSSKRKYDNDNNDNNNNDNSNNNKMMMMMIIMIMIWWWWRIDDDDDDDNDNDDDNNVIMILWRFWILSKQMLICKVQRVDWLPRYSLIPSVFNRIPWYLIIPISLKFYLAMLLLFGCYFISSMLFWIGKEISITDLYVS